MKHTTPRGAAITGLGVVSALGNNIEEFWTACLAGKTTVAPVPPQWSKYYRATSPCWSPLTLPEYSECGLRQSDILLYDPVVLNAIVAADRALDLAGITKKVINARSSSYELEGIENDRLGVYIGTGLGCISSAFNNYVPHLLANVSDEIDRAANRERANDAVNELRNNLSEHSRVSPFASCQSMANAISAVLSIRYRARGANDTCIYACAAGGAAIAKAFRSIQSGEIDVAVAGGSEYYGDRAGGVFMAFDRLRTLVKCSEPLEEGNRPFDKDRTGFLFAQGGTGIVILESFEHARSRGASSIANLVGVSITSDAHSLAAMSKEDNAISLMIGNALREAKLSPTDISYINAHGTSTVQNDEIEADIIQRIFGDKPYVNSTKSLLGHTVGASGAIECIVTALSLGKGLIHPSRNIVEPVNGLNFARALTRCDIEHAFTQSFGFGGHNVGLVLSKA